jgi:hypothetical protein
MSSITPTQPTIEELMSLLTEQSEIITTLTSLLKVNGTNEPDETTQFNYNQQPPTITPTDYEHTITLRDNTIKQLQTHIAQMELQHIEERRLATYRLNELIEVRAELLDETEERQFLQQELDDYKINFQQLGRNTRIAQHNYN